MTTYEYPQVTGGYRWNMLQRIYNSIGIEPISSGDMGTVTFLTFTNPLTVEQKAAVDAIMANSPTQPPTTTNTVFKIIDVWNQRFSIATAMGLIYDVYYSESVPGSGNVDQIELHFRKQLTTQERNKVISEYGKLIAIK